MFDPYYEEDLPFCGTDVTPVINSENKYNCWFIEDPIKKQLEKTVTVILPAGGSLELIVVVKAPMLASCNMLSFIEITHITDNHKVNNTFIEKRIGSNYKINSRTV